MKGRIQRQARALGFDECRFTDAAPPEAGGNFERWLERGWHGEMAYLAANAPKRLEPQRVLPGARSIICVVASYYCASPTGPAGPLPAGGTRDDPEQSSSCEPRLGGVVARYARFSDYHERLGEQLKKLTAFIGQLGGPETKSLWYVDTGPFLERDLAQRAGAGFIGKHTNLIHRRLGNWLFLGQIITTLDLEADQAETNRCGRCTRCLDACPTQAIVAPFQLDARRCISYLTIELKGSIPVELRPAIGRRIYGCDDCLAVCPWNRFAQEGQLMKTHARPELAEPDLIDLLSLDDAGFKRRFADTPITRAKRRGFLRNVCVALGNSGSRSALPALERATHDREPLIAEHARWAMDRIQAAAR